MKYAINIIDWMTYSTDIGLSILIKPVINLDSKPIEVEKKRFDGMGIILDCDPERGGAIAALIRAQFKKHELRLYQSKTGKGGWKRI